VPRDRPTRTAIVVTTYPGDPTLDDRRSAAARGERPRTDFVAVADALGDADVIDLHHVRARGSRAARAVARVAGLPAAQAVEVFARRRHYGHVLVWSDRIGVLLALLLRLRRDHGTDVVLVAVLLTRGAKGALLRRARLDRALRAILVRGAQRRLLAELGVPGAKLVDDPLAVDERFFAPRPVTAERLLCAVGWEERDYATLLRAAGALADVRVELAVGSIAMAPDGGPAHERITALAGAAPPNVRLVHLDPAGLRDLYARAAVVVVPVHDVEFDAGVTAVTEGLAMGRPVVASRTRGLSGLWPEDEGPVLVPPGDARALAAALRALLDDPGAAERRGRSGRALVERCHGFDARTRRIAATVRPAGHDAAGRAARPQPWGPRPTAIDA
jgi:glycosyltransferase involved in cell wall biosynthesis